MMYPVTIFKARYGGAYEGGSWVALHAWDIPSEAQGDDTTCSTWFGDNSHRIGVGSSPNEALEKLQDSLDG